MNAQHHERVKIGLADSGEAAESLSIQIRSHLWITWGRIAMRHETMAHAVRIEAEHLSAGANLSPYLERETDAALVGVCAAAFALHALYTELLDLDSDPPILPPDLQGPWKAQHWMHVPGRFHDTLKRAGPASNPGASSELASARTHRPPEPLL